MPAQFPAASSDSARNKGRGRILGVGCAILSGEMVSPFPRLRHPDQWGESEQGLGYSCGFDDHTEVVSDAGTHPWSWIDELICAHARKSEGQLAGKYYVARSFTSREVFLAADQRLPLR